MLECGGQLGNSRNNVPVIHRNHCCIFTSWRGQVFVLGVSNQVATTSLGFRTRHASHYKLLEGREECLSKHQRIPSPTQKTFLTFYKLFQFTFQSDEIRLHLFYLKIFILKNSTSSMHCTGLSHRHLN